MDRKAFEEGLTRIGLAVDNDTHRRFEMFKSALYAWNESKNLTRVPQDECEVRHFLDSLLFQDLIPNGSSVLDIGTGPGFPAWPLALVRPDLEVTALDSSGKMLDFLKTQPQDNLIVVEVRAEDWGQTEQFDVITGRALAPLAIQLELSSRPCKVGGCIIPMRTPQDRAESERLAENPLGLELERLEQRVLPGLEIPRLFPVFRKQKRTPKDYPRRWSEMRKKPL